VTDKDKKHDAPVDPKSVVAQQPPGQRHPQHEPNTDPEHTESINEPPGSDPTPWYNPTERDQALNKEQERRNYTAEDQDRRREETAASNKKTHEEAEARKAHEEKEAQAKREREAKDDDKKKHR
jgi:hypothetical protein